MDLEELRLYCLSKPETTEELPFGPDTLVFKVAGKMFAACGIDNFETVNLKCDPERAIELRETNPHVKPGYHMNKKHWNTVNALNYPITAELLAMVDHSFDLVVSKLPKALRERIKKAKD